MRRPQAGRRDRIAVLAETLAIVLTALSLAGCEGTPGTDPGVPGGGLPRSEAWALPSDGGLPPGAVELPPGEVDTLFLSSSSGARAEGRLVVDSEQAWEEAWSRLRGGVVPSEAPPRVDFSTHRVLVLSMGARPTGGYTIEVASLGRDGDVLYVPVLELSPGPGCVTTQAVTHPALAIGVPLGAGTVEFLEAVGVRDCG